MGLTEKQRKSLGQSGRGNNNDNNNEQCMICSGTGRLRERVCPNCAGHGTVAPGIYDDDNGLGTVNAGIVKRAAAAVEAREKAPWQQRSTTGDKAQWEDLIENLEYLHSEELKAPREYHEAIKKARALGLTGYVENLDGIVSQEKNHAHLIQNMLKDARMKKPLR